MKTGASRKVDICGVMLDNVSQKFVLKKIEKHISKREPAYIVTANVDHIIKLQKDEEFRRAYDNAFLALADGAPLVMAAGFLGHPLIERVTGADLLPALCALSAKEGYGVFLLGGKSRGGILLVAKILKKRYPGLRIVGAHSPHFGFEDNPHENEKIVRKIKESRADILFVGLGAPKQEKWICRFKNEYNVPISIGIGVSFNFISGRVRRAPVWMQKIGLEWLWRLMAEPRRLWKRYLVDDMQFFRLVLKQKMKGP